MAEPRRIQKADAIYFVSNYTIEGLPLMDPSEQVDAIITNNLAWAAAVRGIELFVYSFRPDRFFMIFSAPRLNRGKFMGDFQGQIAKQINALRGRSGKFFAGRYQCSHLLDSHAVVEQLARVLADPCRADNESGPKGKRHGVSSWTLHKSGEPLVGQREDRTLYRELRRAHPELSEDEASRLATTTYEVDLAKLPAWSEKTHMSYHRHVIATTRNHLEAPDVASSDIREFQNPIRPFRSKSAHPPFPQTRQPRCMTSVPALRETFLEEVADRNYRYDIARARLRRRRGKPRFPHGMIPPHRSWAVGATRDPAHPPNSARADRPRSHQLSASG